MSNKQFFGISFLIVSLVIGLIWLSIYFINSRSYDWPQWRYDANRSAASPQKLPSSLHLQWMREYPKLTQAWENPLNKDLMQYDKVYEPVVLGKTLFVGSNASDRMTALDTETGEEEWIFYADGPVRLPPVADNGKVYFVSDDGYLYCVDAKLGNLLWKFQGAPSDRKILGNSRLISTWPARGGPVFKDGVIYFAAGIWPFMGTFIYALDAETGKIIWENDGMGSRYMKQPHNSPSYSGVAPQGSFVISGDQILIPCGRSMPACFDRRTGELLYYHLAKYNKTGGAFVCASKNYFVNYHRDFVTSIFDLSDGERLISRFGKIPVMTDKTLFSMGKPIIAYDLGDMEKQVYRERIVVDKKDEDTEIVEDKKWVLDRRWSLNVDASGDLIKAGKRLYAGGKNVVSAIKIPIGNGEPKVTWTAHISGTATRLIAADNKLFVVTLGGDIYAFAGKKNDAPKIYPYTVEDSTVTKSMSIKVASILASTGVRAGYCLAYGLENGDLVEALARKSNLQIIAVDPDPDKVDGLRKKLDAAGLYGKKISVHVGSPSTFEAPPYLASLILFENGEQVGKDVLDLTNASRGKKNRQNEQDLTIQNEQPGSLGIRGLQKIYRRLRPYGGVACLSVDADDISAVTQQIQNINLPKVKIRESGGYLLLIREGELPGTADWTHQYGDIANTVKSDDQLVKLPLGILWFGGSSNMDVLPRHGHGPPEQVIGGRLFIEGIDKLSARDVYTGRVLWKRTFSDLDTYEIYYGATYKNTPLSTSYNQVHIPGANARGTNFVATLDKVYVIMKSSCMVLDSATGKIIDEFKLPTDPKTAQAPELGYIGVYKDFLILGAEFVRYLDFLELNELNSGMKSKPYADYNFDITSSKKLIIMDRHTGEILWTHKSELGFRHSAIAVGDDKIFCIDAIPPLVSDALKRRLGEYHFGTPKIVALNLHNGRTVWSEDENVFGTWLSYSKEHDVLIQAGRDSRDMLKGEPEGMSAYTGKDGTFLWNNDEVTRGGPFMLHGDKIITDRYAYSLLTGEQKTRIDPLTGEERPWLFKRNYGCNYAVASEHLLTFRSAAAGFYDLMRDGGTGNFGGFKSGCTSNLIVANGVLNAPDYTRTCSCSYPNQTSLAMVHDPDVELWTTYFDERKYNVIAPSSRAIAFTDLSGNLTYVNNSFISLLGYKKETDVVGKSFVEFWDTKSKADYQQLTSEILATVGRSSRLPSPSETPCVRDKMTAVEKDDDTFDVHLVASTITDENGKPVSMMFSFVKATDTATAFFDSDVGQVANLSDVGQVANLSDLEWNLTYVNNSFISLWGYGDETEVLGRSFLEFVAPSETTELEAMMLSLMQDATGDIEGELMHSEEFVSSDTICATGDIEGELIAMREDGKTRDVHFSASKVTDDAGKSTYVAASFVDITEHKKALEEIESLKKHDYRLDYLRNDIKQFITGNEPIRKVGINFGAPGDRRADDGTLWLEYPRVSGSLHNIPVTFKPELLFSVALTFPSTGLTFQEELDDKTISEDLCDEFEDNDFVLSQNATVSIKEKGRKWLITSVDGKKTYFVKRSVEKLNVYKPEKLGDATLLQYERFVQHSSQIQGDGLKWVAASGVKGLSSVKIRLTGEADDETTQSDHVETIAERSYTVRLYFSEPDDKKPGQRVFDVEIRGVRVLRHGMRVLENFDIVKEADGPNRLVVKEFKNVLVKKDLAVTFTRSDSDSRSLATFATSPLICGIEILAEGW